ncbi:thiosulfate oxidation carrier complex protein SoxZ [Limnohabitans sp. 2KL-17]|uniref:thiosulfate oxidation carrier complex protein SoxZ n=1 Tax=Limnohabitans sp. 2KL-17 TaxID=1100704 RepID=UPI000D3D714C|nr:thiosulfate oxidation carrier complex protein SoxZ [Limnohabitans sp. 2KL-17]PUE62521.1 thiosulfate oxidation carrier complex protein SoxZ [Limnohabitans sp. 2KL-17]
MNLARIQWPERITAGDVVKVRLLVQHPMDTGYLYDLLGKLVPRNVITLLTCTLGQQEVFRAEPSSGIAANPLFEFFVRASETAEMRVEWEDDRGKRGEFRQTMTVLPSTAR